MSRPHLWVPGQRWQESIAQTRTPRVGPAPVFSQYGAVTPIASVDQIDVPLPASVAANEVGFVWIATSTPVPATNINFGTFNELGQAAGVGGTDFYGGAGWFRFTGSEGGGNVSLTFDAPVMGVARVVTYLGCKTTGDPFEALAEAQDVSLIMSTSGITTLGPNRLAVALCMTGRGNVVAAMNNSWSELALSDQSGGSGNRLVIEHHAAAAAGAIPAGSVTFAAANDDWLTYTLALLPMGA